MIIVTGALMWLINNKTTDPIEGRRQPSFVLWWEEDGQSSPHPCQRGLKPVSAGASCFVSKENNDDDDLF